MSIHSDNRRLMSPLYENTIAVSVKNQKLKNEIATKITLADADKDEKGIYRFEPNEYQQFEILASPYEQGEDWEEVNIEEMSVSPGAGAYNASLNATPKQYKGPEFKEDVNSGYKKVKGFRPGHSKITIVEPKDLWNLHEREETEKFGFKIGDKVNIKDEWPDVGYGDVVGFEDEDIKVNVRKGGGSTFIRTMVFHPSKLEHQKSDDKEDMETLKEGLKTEIKVRSKKQQFQEATKMANKKLKEINSILEFAHGLKTELHEVECESCSRMMENMKRNIAEVYKKMKNL